MILQVIEFAGILAAIALTPKLVDVQLTNAGKNVRDQIQAKAPGIRERFVALKDATVAKVQEMQLSPVIETDATAVEPEPESAIVVAQPAKSVKSGSSKTLKVAG